MNKLSPVIYNKWLFVFFLLLSVFQSKGQIYVSTTGDDGNDGKSPGQAKATLAAAIGVIGSETVKYIKLGPGTFTITTGVNLPSNVRLVGEGADQTTIKVTTARIGLQSGSILSN